MVVREGGCDAAEIDIEMYIEADIDIEIYIEVHSKSAKKKFSVKRKFCPCTQIGYVRLP